MRTIRQKAYAKVNLFLDITGIEDGYHTIDTVVTTISLYDELVISKRKDDKIVFRTHGSLYSVTDSYDNNVYKAAKLFQERFATKGVDITLHKNLPVSSGLGGSSADIAGTLIGLKKLFDKNADVKELADALGSDSGYLLEGGFARLTGRGEIVESLDISKKLYFVIACAKGGVNTAACYKKYDELEKPTYRPTSEEFIERLKSDSAKDDDYFNALYPPAAEINPKVKELYEAMKALSPKGCAMSGSGSGVFAIFDSAELCEWAKEKIKKIVKDVFVAESLTKEEMNKRSFFFRNLYSIEEDR